MNPDYLPGHLVGVDSESALANLQRAFFQPPTKLYHFLVVRSRLEEEDDYEVIEMLGNGCAIGRLSWYSSRRYVVFEPAAPGAMLLGKRAAKYASKFGRRRYDYGVFFRMPADLVRCWSLQFLQEHRLRRIHPDELKFVRDSKFVCTELAREIWLQVGIDPLQPWDAAFAPAFLSAVATGRLKIIDEHDPETRRCETIRLTEALLLA